MHRRFDDRFVPVEDEPYPPDYDPYDDVEPSTMKATPGANDDPWGCEIDGPEPF